LVALEKVQAAIDAILADEPDFVVFLGDEAGVHFVHDRLTRRTEGMAASRWRNWRSYFERLVASVPSFMVLGNHEGEAGFYQSFAGVPLQRRATVARKRHYLNPLPDTYAEGGENEGWRGDQRSKETGGANDGNCSPLQNYFAWTWGDALFVVLDVHRYTNVGGTTPRTPREWTLGPAQLAWLRAVLTTSRARWKFVIAHHLVGGSGWDASGLDLPTVYAYGRGGARYARAGEQDTITELMRQNGAQFFLYGHDHIFAHQQAEDIHFVCCGRPSKLTHRWWQTPGWSEMYGDVERRDPHDFYAAIGYTRLTISPGKVRLDYIRTGEDPGGNENVSTPVGGVVYGFDVA
jgi:hypothetical protein